MIKKEKEKCVENTFGHMEFCDILLEKNCISIEMKKVLWKWIFLHSF